MSNNKKVGLSLSGNVCIQDYHDFLTNVNALPKSKFKEPFTKKKFIPKLVPAEPKVEQDFTLDYVQRELEKEETESKEVDDMSTPFLQLEQLDELSLNSEANFQTFDDIEFRIRQNYFNRPHRYDESLPIFKKLQDIVKMVAYHQVVIIDGTTGCGKTTQVPQYIIDDAMKQGRKCNIIVTQPRKIAARSIAHRVCHERAWQLGTLCGYQVSLDSQSSQDTRILYVTTGVLLNLLLIEKRIDSFTHIILDEVHERDTEIDLAMLFIKKLLQTNKNCGTKIILMSATMESDKYQNYFAKKVQSQVTLAYLIPIKGSMNKVDDFYLNNLMSPVEVPKFDKSDPQVYPECIRKAKELIIQFDEFERSEQEHSKTPTEKIPRGTVLVFLPGYHEIVVMAGALKERQTLSKWNLLFLHSSVTFEEQNRVFHPPQPGYRKIILSTNICESSITVPDIKYVIDFCLTKVLMCDPQTNLSSLQTVWAPKSNCTQRKGRAGRVAEGRCYRMITLEFYKNELDNYSTPEILNSPLATVVLKAKKFDQGTPESVLAYAINPPLQENIRRAVLDLKGIGALSLYSGDQKIRWDGNMTFIGRIIGNLPLDVCLGKLVVYGYAFGVLKEAIIIASCLSMRNIFLKPFQKHLEAYKSKLSWADGTFSDCLAFLFSYIFYQAHKREQTFHRPGGQTEEAWCQRNYIELKRIREVEELVRDITRRLQLFNIFVEESHPQEDSNQIQVLKVVICASFYPNYYSSNILEERTVLKEIHSLDPSNTVIVGNLPSYQGLLYSYSINEYLKGCGDVMHIEYDNTKAMVVFDKRTHSKTDEKWVIQPIYLAIKKGRLERFELKTYEESVGKQKMENVLKWKNDDNRRGMMSNQTKISMVYNASQMKRVTLPKLDEKTVNLKVTSIISCSHFWAQKTDDKTTHNHLSYITETIALIVNEPPSFEGTVVVGELILAPFKEGNIVHYYRAIVQLIKNQNLEVFFIDYGNTERVKLSQIYKCPKELGETPMVAFECYLSNIKPLTYKSKFEGQWTAKATEHFVRLVDNNILIGHIFSVIENVVRLELFSFVSNSMHQISVNNSLIEAGYAEKAEESIPSKLDNEARNNDDVNKLMGRHSIDSLKPFNFSAEDCKHFTDIVNATKLIRLKGPYSPLELNFAGITNSSAQKSVRIDSDSLNSIVLNPEPQERHSRMLVACHVCLNREKSAVQLHATTLMPSIPGIMGLMAMSFAPNVELRMNKEKTKLIGALCGLGLEADGRAVNTTNDAEIAFDAEIDSQDICVINNIRGDLNIILQDTKQVQNESPETVAVFSNRLQENLLKLLSRHREYREPLSCEHFFCWSKGQMEMEPTERNNPNVLPLIKLGSIEEDKWKTEMKEHLEDLKTKSAKGMRPLNEKCKLCKELLPTTRHVFYHLDSEIHLENLKKFKLVD